MQVLRVEAMKYKHGWEKKEAQVFTLKTCEFDQGCVLLLHAVLSVSAYIKPP